MLLRFFLIAIGASVVVAQNSTTDDQLAKRMASMHDAWGPRASSPGASLTIVEESRTGPDFRYGLKATGIPAGGVFTLVTWPVTQRDPTEVLQGVTFNDKGYAICAGRPGTCGDPANPNDPIHIPFRPAPGEPLRLGISSSDGSVRALAKITPLPWQGDDKGCRVSATLLTPGVELAFIEGTGFASNTEVFMNTDSEGEKHDIQGKADSQGRFTYALLPYKQGLTHGTLKLVLKTAACSPGISVPWGK